MKKILLLSLIAICSLGSHAQSTNKKACMIHEPIPKLKGVDSLTYDEEVRSKLLSNGWKPVPISEDEKGVFFDDKKPEQYCSATICISTFKDKKNNKLTLVMDDFIKKVELSCSNQ